MDLSFDTVDLTDADQRRACYDVLAAAHVGLPGDPLPEFSEWDEFVENMSAREGYALLTASCGDDAVAAATLSLPDSEEVSDSALVHVYVLPEYRRQGVGTAFVDHFRASLPADRVALLGAARVSDESTVAMKFATTVGATALWTMDQFSTSEGLDLATVDACWKEFSAQLDGYSVRAAVGGLAGNYLEAYLDYVDQTIDFDLPDGYDEAAYFEELEEYDAEGIAVLDTIVADSDGRVVAAQRTLVPADSQEDIMVDMPVAVTEVPDTVLLACLAKTLRSLAKFFPRYTEYLCMVEGSQDLRSVLETCGVKYSHTNTNVALER